MFYLFLIPTICIGILGFLQLWTDFLSFEVFIKLCITYLIYILVLSAIYGLQQYFAEQKVLKDKNLVN